jgi:23S rRNA pseudouridine1911/1915/1917 synthase
LTDRILSFLFDQPVPQRLDKFLVICVPDLSRSRLQGLIEDGFVLVNGVMAYKSGQMLVHDAKVELHIPPTEPSVLIPKRSLGHRFENDDLMVVNKPAGGCARPGRQVRWSTRRWRMRQR